MSFAADLSKFETRATDAVGEVRRAVVAGLFGAIIKGTPALTGRLRGNWQTNVASPLTGELPLRSEGQAMAEMLAAAESVKGDETVYLRNNLPYAARIEFDGWSHEKAPAGMVRINMARIQPLVEAAVQKGKL